MTKTNDTRNAAAYHQLEKAVRSVGIGWTVEVMTFRVISQNSVCISVQNCQGAHHDASFVDVDEARHQYRQFVRAGWTVMV